MVNEGYQLHNFINSSGSGTVINYGSSSDFSTCYGSRSGSTSQKVTVPTVPVPVRQRWKNPSVCKSKYGNTLPYVKYSMKKLINQNKQWLWKKL